ncbi:hypothetical protein [Sphingomicrobium marinum]|nr:hypothetical protein [Sphingomicrobium marinum]
MDDMTARAPTHLRIVAIMPIVVIVIAAGLLYYARKQDRAGVMR